MAKALEELRVSGQEAQQKISSRLGRRRKDPPFPQILREAKYSKQWRIFNVGPWEQVRHTGSTGTFVIPACPTAKQCLVKNVEKPAYVEMPRPIYALMDELLIKDELQQDRLIDDGYRFALEVLGQGRGQNPAQSLLHVGCFVAAGDTPTEQELAQANLMLNAQCSAMIAEIRNIYATDRKFFAQLMSASGQTYYRAAEVLNLESEEWMTSATPANQVKCKGCGAMADADVATCPNGHILNLELYEEFMAEQQAMEERAKDRAKGKKAK